MGHIGTSRMMSQRWWLNGFAVVHCRDAIHRVSKTAANPELFTVAVHGDAMNRVSTMGGDDVEWICGDIFANNISLNNRNMLYLHII